MTQPAAAFVRAMDRSTNLSEGENGALEHVSTNESQLDLFFALVRGLPELRLTELLATAIRNAHSCEDKTNLFVLLFQTRDCRGGKGEKELFYRMFRQLYNHFPAAGKVVLPLVPHYGYYKDYLHLLGENPTEELVAAVADIFFGQLKKDLDALRRGDSISMCAKYVPREGKAVDKKRKAAWKLLSYEEKREKEKRDFFHVLLGRFYPPYTGVRWGIAKSTRQWIAERACFRKMVLGPLGAALEIPEIFMCAQRYEEINFSRVPSVCMNRNRKAFLNEQVSPFPKGHKHRLAVPLDGERKPNDPGRAAARANLLAAAAEGKVLGRRLMPHEMVSQMMAPRGVSAGEATILEAQWSSMRSTVGSLGKMIPLVDVSKSMEGTPMTVAIALGILISEVTHPAFRDRFITFETAPQWCNFTGCTTLRDKVTRAMEAPWGGSTNLTAALELVLQVALEANLPPSELPESLIVLSDMQFNQADPRLTTFEWLKERFAAAGYTLPKIVFWNLRGDTRGFPATSFAENVQMLSGFSPALLRLVLDGETICPSATICVPSNGIAPVTPGETYRRAIYDERYDLVRRTLAAADGDLDLYEV